MNKLTPTPLSDIPSEILLQSLEDLEAVEKMPNTLINMGTWIDPQGAYCEVCHAGAVMMNRLGCSREIKSDPYILDSKNEAKIYFINRVRMGEVYFGIKTLYYEGVINKAPESIVNYEVPLLVSQYHSSEQQEYKNYIQFVAGILQAEGL